MRRLAGWCSQRLPNKLAAQRLAGHFSIQVSLGHRTRTGALDYPACLAMHGFAAWSCFADLSSDHLSWMSCLVLARLLLSRLSGH
jgi:hypothetical protein